MFRESVPTLSQHDHLNCIITNKFVQRNSHCYPAYIVRDKKAPGGRRTLERPRRRWVDNIRMDLQEVGCGYMDWTGLAQDGDRWRTLVSAVMNLRVP